MANMMKVHHSLFYILFLLLHAATTQANTGYLQDQQEATELWQDITTSHHARTAQDPSVKTQRRALSLNTEHLHKLVETNASGNQSDLLIAVPLPDGTNTLIKLQPVATLSKALQQRYPTIKTWRISSAHPRIISGRAELTPGGFHIMLQSDDGDQWLTEPASIQLPQDSQRYHAYSKRKNSNQHNQIFSCRTQTAYDSSREFQQHTSALINSTPEHATSNYALRTGTKMLSYDLAISATGEYTRQFGNSALQAYGAIVSTVNRVNEIYERELGITFQLVSGTETVFTDSLDDPFDNASPLSLLEQNQQLLDTLIGANNYDLGHVFSVLKHDTGIASVASLCQDDQKAQGLSAAKALLNDRFIVDYVAHELGHQLGATHTFNSELNACGGGNRIAETAFEPGSGSTIMSYAGLCDSDDIQQHAMPQFHSGSVEQILQNTVQASTATCATQITLANNQPVVTASNNYTIPARTPFILKGLASDSDGDTLLYSWDQIDTGNASPPNTDTMDNALIKSNPLTNTSVRYVPAISTLLNTSQTINGGEFLPHSSRELNFRFSARDGRGAVSSDDLKITVFDTGADFRITYPESSLNAGRHAVHWQVAYTNQSPINCSQVDIAYTNDQGITFTDLIRQTPNDGGALVQLNQHAEYIRVKCSNNTFFTLSGTTPKIASHPAATEQQIPADAEKDIRNGGGGSTSLIGLLSGTIFVILLRIRSRRKSAKRILQDRD